MMAERKTLNARIIYGARLVLSREPTDRELTALRALFEKAVAMPNLKPAAAKMNNDPGELTALTSVASVLINLDAALTR